ncbi:phosphotriesterase-related protein [Actinomadura vinacea]|uniref:Phosphotriesterase-related protein n=1 Tax=Actinomadura vinacea TaxID=115336 RepID=A0ABN3IRH1_9ACTN
MPVTTVLGSIDTTRLGHTQPHEHLFCDLRGYLRPEHRQGHPIGLANYYRSRVDRDNAEDMVLDDVEAVADALEDYHRAGGGSIVDATPRGLGRSPETLLRIARRSRVNIIMGCGYYTQPFHPGSVHHDTEEDITNGIVADLVDGVDVGGTTVRAGIIGEIGMSSPTHPDEEKVLRAAARAQRLTGAALLIHPGRSPEAPLQHLGTVAAAGGDIERVVMSHIDRTLFDLDAMLAVADTGCVLEFDLFGSETSYYPQNPDVDLPNDGHRVHYIRELVDRGYGSQVAISEDVCRKTQLKPYGGEGYEHILRRVKPLMRVRGIRETDIEQITERTPARLLNRD